MAYVIVDFDNLQIDTFTPEQGVWSPSTGEILFERTAIKVAQAEIGDTVVVKLPNVKDERALSVTGTVHAPGLPPAWVEGRVYGYITPETLALFGGDFSLNQLILTVAKMSLMKHISAKPRMRSRNGWRKMVIPSHALISLNPESTLMLT